MMMGLSTAGSVSLLSLLSLASTAYAATLCTNTTNLQNVQYVISPNFAWFPTDATSDDVVNQIRKANPSIFPPPPGTTPTRRPLSPPPGLIPNVPGSSTLRVSIPRFLNSPCLFTLKMEPTPAFPAEQLIRLLNETLSSSDLLGRLALHKTGDVRTEYAHTMLTMHIRGVIQQPQKRLFRRQGGTTTQPPPEQPKEPEIPANGEAPPATATKAPPQLPDGGPPKSPTASPVVALPREATSKDTTASRLHIRQGKLSDRLQAPGFEYTINCPPTLGRPKDGAAAAAVIEGLKDVALVKDCGWCRRAIRELSSPCKINGAFDTAASSGMWVFGSAVCEGCLPSSKR